MAGQRGMMTLIGALAGVSFYLLAVVIEAERLSGRSALALAVFAGIFFGGVMITTGPIRLWRSALGAAVLGLVLAGLFTLASLRYPAVEGLDSSALALFSLTLLAWLPWPFLIAAQSAAGWRDYPTLFQESWGIVVRVLVALLFTGVVWALIALSNALLNLVGLRFIETVLEQPAAPWLITGAVLGLAMAVVNELSDILSPGLLLRLLRLLLPVVLAVMAIFLVALPLQGFSRVFGGVSSTGVLLAMAAVAATLVTAALDQEDETCAQGAITLQSARILAGILILPAGLAAWALGLRVSAYGWTPSRLMAATLVGLSLAYGICYLWAVLHRRGWMDWIRRANVWIALATMALAALWLSLFSPEAISAHSQLARLSAGPVPEAQSDLAALRSWGYAGQEALERLRVLAEQSPDLARSLAQMDAEAPVIPDGVTLRQSLTAGLPLQPDTEANRAFRDRILAETQIYDLNLWQEACAKLLSQGGAGCVLVFADFLPAKPGDEAMFLARNPQGYLITEGFSLAGGALRRFSLTSYDVDYGEKGLPRDAEAEALVAQAQKAAPTVAVPLTALQLPGQPALVFAP